MPILKEFREFISRGNVIGLAVAVVIGAAFSKIVTSLVTDVIMPPIGLVLGKVDFSSLFITLNGQTYESLAVAKEKGAPVLAYGAFLNTCIEFIIVSACVFALVKVINTIYKQQEAAPKVSKTDTLLEEIRDLLKKGQ